MSNLQECHGTGLTVHRIVLRSSVWIFGKHNRHTPTQTRGLNNYSQQLRPTVLTFADANRYG